MTNAINYFPHDSRAHVDKNVIKLRMTLGWSGYGMYWAIVEILRDQKGYELPTDPSDQLAFMLAVDEEDMRQAIQAMKTCGLFVDDGTAFYSESLKRRMECIDAKLQRRREIGRMGGEAKAVKMVKKAIKKAERAEIAPRIDSNLPPLKEQAETLYGLYPRKVAKPAAIKAILKALAKEEYLHLLECVEEYANAVDGHPDKSLIPHPATWFNQERWTDDRDEWKRWRMSIASPAQKKDAAHEDEIAAARRRVQNATKDPFSVD